MSSSSSSRYRASLSPSFCRCRCHRSLIVVEEIKFVVVVVIDCCRRCRCCLFVARCPLSSLLVDCCLLSSAVVDSGGGDVKRIRTHMFKFKLISCRMFDPIRRSCDDLRFEFINFGAWGCHGQLQVCQLENEIRFSTPLHIHISLPLPVASYKYELHSSVQYFYFFIAVIEYSTRYCSIRTYTCTQVLYSLEYCSSYICSLFYSRVHSTMVRVLRSVHYSGVCGLSRMVCVESSRSVALNLSADAFPQPPRNWYWSTPFVRVLPVGLAGT